MKFYKGLVIKILINNIDEVIRFLDVVNVKKI